MKEQDVKDFWRITFEKVAIIIFWVTLIIAIIFLAYGFWDIITEIGDDQAYRQGYINGSTDSYNRIIVFIKTSPCGENLALESINDSVDFKKQCNAYFDIKNSWGNIGWIGNNSYPFTFVGAYK